MSWSGSSRDGARRPVPRRQAIASWAMPTSTSVAAAVPRGRDRGLASATPRSRAELSSTRHTLSRASRRDFAGQRAAYGSSGFTAQSSNRKSSNVLRV